MLAKRKSDSKVIEVVEWRGSSDVYYSEPNKTKFYQASDLDFDVEEETDSDLRISVAKLREVLGKMQGNLLNDAVIDKIINKVKSKLCAKHIKSA